MKLIITAAGLGSRFFNEGFKLPKYLIKANGKTLLEHSLSTLEDFYSYEFIFIFRNIDSIDDIKKIISNCKNKRNESLKNYQIINLENPTKGQADTVLNAEKFFEKDDDVLIYNIDTFVKNSIDYINKKDISTFVDGIIYTTKAPGEHWSFAKTMNNSDKVIEVSEKLRISENASIGLYYFKSFYDFYRIVKSKNLDIIKEYKELYVMPIYKYLIEENKNIIIKDIPFDNFVPLGTPKEVFDFDNNFEMENKNV